MGFLPFLVSGPEPSAQRRLNLSPRYSLDFLFHLIPLFKVNVRLSKPVETREQPVQCLPHMGLPVRRNFKTLVFMRSCCGVGLRHHRKLSQYRWRVTLLHFGATAAPRILPGHHRRLDDLHLASTTKILASVHLPCGHRRHPRRLAEWLASTILASTRLPVSLFFYLLAMASTINSLHCYRHLVS